MVKGRWEGAKDLRTCSIGVGSEDGGDAAEVRPEAIYSSITGLEPSSLSKPFHVIRLGNIYDRSSE